MLSVIIPVYNVEKYLTRCIESIIAQTYADWEMILVDDGSTDDSGLICDNYERNDERIKVLHQENQGVSSARNKGIEEAKGSHIIFIDSDDWIEPEMFSVMMRGNESDIVVCGFNRVTISAEGGKEIEEVNPWPGKKQVELITDKFFHEIVCKSGTLWNKIIKTECIASVRFDNRQSYGEDAVFLAKVLKNVKSVKIIKKPLYQYYKNRPGNVVSSSVDDRVLDYLNNARIIYNEACLTEEAQSGVYKIQMTVWDVLGKIAGAYDKKEIYIRECIATLRYPSFMHVMSYLLGKEYRSISFRDRLQYLFYYFCPHIMLFKERGWKSQ